jgi:hypothetical protein
VTAVKLSRKAPLRGEALAATLAPLKRSGDRKVSTLVRRKDATKDEAVLRNAFGLPAGLSFSCPFATAVCYSTDKPVCYAAKLEAGPWGKAIGGVIGNNWESLQACGDDVEAMETLLSAMIADFRDDVTKAVKHSKGTWESLASFRIHWDGDYYSAAYAQAWHRVIVANPDVTFWSYTRSHVYAHLLIAPNHPVYLSIDAENLSSAMPILQAFPALHAAVLGSTWEHAEKLYASLGRDRMTPRCPELTGRISLTMPTTRGARFEIKDFGRGACIACGMCVYGKRDVLFSIDHSKKGK